MGNDQLSAITFEAVVSVKYQGKMQTNDVTLR